MFKFCIKLFKIANRIKIRNEYILENNIKNNMYGNFLISKTELLTTLEEFQDVCRDNNRNDIKKTFPSIASIYLTNKSHGIIMKKIVDINSNIIVLGDLYGSVYSLSRLLINMYVYGIIDGDFNIVNRDKTNIVILGNLFDSGENNGHIIEIQYLIMKLKITNPENVFILQSGHNNTVNDRLYEQLGNVYNEGIYNIHKMFIETWKLLPAILLLGAKNNNKNNNKIEYMYFSQGGHDNKVDLKEIINDSNNNHKITTQYAKYNRLANAKWNNYTHDLFPFDIKTHLNTHIYGLKQAIYYCKKYNIRCIIKGNPNSVKRWTTKVYLTQMDQFNKIYELNKNLFDDVTKGCPIGCELLDQSDEYYIDKTYKTANLVISDIDSDYNELDIAPVYVISSNKRDSNHVVISDSMTVLSFNECSRDIFRIESVIEFIKNKEDYENKNSDLVTRYEKLIELYKKGINDNKNGGQFESTNMMNKRMIKLFKDMTAIKFSKFKN
jgi:hypothetical protein